MLGIHVVQLEAPASGIGKRQIARLYLLSVVARWSGSDQYPRKQTFRLESSVSENASDNDRNPSYPTALAMDTLMKSELLTAVSLANATIVVFRAGLSPEMLQPEEK